MSVCPTLKAKTAQSSSPLDLIDAPTNLGLRPNDRGALPGTAKATKALRAAGLDGELRFRTIRHITPLAYDRAAQASTHIRNGQSPRIFDLELAHAVVESIDTGGFPIVLGGDCSNLLGGLLGLRWTTGRGLVHIDGHSDFIHPGNYDLSSRLGSAAGMDLALATGRGEGLLTEWPGIEGPLVADSDVDIYVHLGAQECVLFIVNTLKFRVKDIPGAIDDHVRLSLATKFMEVGFLEIHSV
jgi:arginase